MRNAAEDLVEEWSDPSLEKNWLRRPATRTCMCGTIFKLRMGILVKGATLCPECRKLSKEELLRRYGPPQRALEDDEK